MQFTVDSLRLVVTIAARPLYHDGQPCKARFDRARRRIWLSDQLPRHERRRALMHELQHAFIDARGLANDEERAAVDGGEFLDAMIEQYMQQGGDAVLESLNPEEQITGIRPNSASTFRVETRCGHCGAPIAPGEVDTSAPEWSADTSGWILHRGFFCENCDGVTTWSEACTPEGTPLGQILERPAPELLRGKPAAAWIAAHQEKCRVMVV